MKKVDFITDENVLDFSIQDNTVNFEIDNNITTFNVDNDNYNFNVENEQTDFSVSEILSVSPIMSYRPLSEKPQINNHILHSGNNTYEYLGVEPTITDITEQDIDNMIFGE